MNNFAFEITFLLAGGGGMIQYKEICLLLIWKNDRSCNITHGKHRVFILVLFILFFIIFQGL